VFRTLKILTTILINFFLVNVVHKVIVKMLILILINLRVMFYYNLSFVRKWKHHKHNLHRYLNYKLKQRAEVEAEVIEEGVKGELQ
jgi:hypothetical protein